MLPLGAAGQVTSGVIVSTALVTAAVLVVPACCSQPTGVVLAATV